MVMDVSLLNTKNYKVHIRGKVPQSKDKSNAPPYISAL